MPSVHWFYLIWSFSPFSRRLVPTQDIVLLKVQAAYQILFSHCFLNCLWSVSELPRNENSPSFTSFTSPLFSLCVLKRAVPGIVLCADLLRLNNLVVLRIAGRELGESGSDEGEKM